MKQLQPRYCSSHPKASQCLLSPCVVNTTHSNRRLFPPDQVLKADKLASWVLIPPFEG